MSQESTASSAHEQQQHDQPPDTIHPPRICTVDFDCNDVRGQRLGTFEAIEIEVGLRTVDTTISITIEGDPLEIEFGPLDITVTHPDRSFLRVRYEIAPHSLRRHQGNLCWDSVAMPFEAAVQLARNLIDSGWVVTEGTESGWLEKEIGHAL